MDTKFTNPRDLARELASLSCVNFEAKGVGSERENGPKEGCLGRL